MCQSWCYTGTDCDGKRLSHNNIFRSIIPSYLMVLRAELRRSSCSSNPQVDNAKYLMVFWRVGSTPLLIGGCASDFFVAHNPPLARLISVPGPSKQVKQV